MCHRQDSQHLQWTVGARLDLRGPGWPTDVTSTDRAVTLEFLLSLPRRRHAVVTSAIRCLGVQASTPTQKLIVGTAAQTTDSPCHSSVRWWVLGSTHLYIAIGWLVPPGLLGLCLRSLCLSGRGREQSNRESKVTAVRCLGARKVDCAPRGPAGLTSVYLR